MSFILNQNNALREIHENGLELLVHAADLCELEELRLISLLYFVEGDEQEDQCVKEDWSRNVVKIPIHCLVEGKSGGNCDNNRDGSEYPVGIAEHPIEDHVLYPGDAGREGTLGDLGDTFPVSPQERPHLG